MTHMLTVVTNVEITVRHWNVIKFSGHCIHEIKIDNIPTNVLLQILYSFSITEAKVTKLILRFYPGNFALYCKNYRGFWF